MRDKNTIINRMVDDAAEVMEAKAEYDELVIGQLVGNPAKAETVAILRERVKKTREAVALMRDNAGCWA